MRILGFLSWFEDGRPTKRLKAVSFNLSTLLLKSFNCPSTVAAIPWWESIRNASPMNDSLIARKTNIVGPLG
jgi:hypothetical protein